MTRKTFYKKLRQFAHRFRWKVDGIHCLRANSRNNRITDCCPITFLTYCLTNKKYENFRAIEAGGQIGLSAKDCNMIMTCADLEEDELEGNQKIVRRTLLEAVFSG